MDWNNFGQQGRSFEQGGEFTAGGDWVDRVTVAEADLHQQSGNFGMMFDALAKLFIFRQRRRG
jgi:hypothetical protein